MGANEAAERVWSACIGTNWHAYFEDGEECRSLPLSASLDVKIGDEWFRLTAVPIAEPVSLTDYEAGAVR